MFWFNSSTQHYTSKLDWQCPDTWVQAHAWHRLQVPFTTIENVSWQFQLCERLRCHPFFTRTTAFWNRDIVKLVYCDVTRRGQPHTLLLGAGMVSHVLTLTQCVLHKTATVFSCHQHRSMHHLLLSMCAPAHPSLQSNPTSTPSFIPLIPTISPTYFLVVI